ncbi:MAG: phytanoyl-CoA dioxygenase family protein [Pseudomonadota bacterium]
MSADVETLPADSAVETIIEVLDDDGVVIVSDFMDPSLLERFNTEIQPAIDTYKQFHFGNQAIDGFLGSRTVRLHGLAAHAPSFADIILDPRLLAITDHYLLPCCSSYLLSAGELIEIRGGETAQHFHVDDGSWPIWARRGADLLQMNYMIAATDFTAANGATLVVPGSHRWSPDSAPVEGEIAQAVMPAGSMAIVRGDTQHAGGTNTDGTVRRALSVSYCLGWLRAVENSYLNLDIDVLRALPAKAQQLLGYDIYDGSQDEVRSGFLGYYQMGSPKSLLDA